MWLMCLVRPSGSWARFFTDVIYRDLPAVLGVVDVLLL